MNQVGDIALLHLLKKQVIYRIRAECSNTVVQSELNLSKFSFSETNGSRETANTHHKARVFRFNIISHLFLLFTYFPFTFHTFLFFFQTSSFNTVRKFFLNKKDRKRKEELTVIEDDFMHRVY